MERKSPLRESPSQTAGPFVHIGCTPNQAGINNVYPQDLGNASFANNVFEGQELFVRILDGQKHEVNDAMVEIWNAERSQWARQTFNPDRSGFVVEFIKPESNIQEVAPHICLWIVARGINLGLHTRVYFPDEDNQQDHVLSMIPEHRRETLIADKTDTGYAFTVLLQGDRETVFFDV